MKRVIIFIVIVLSVYLNNASWLIDKPQGKASLLAHRGVHQTYSKEALSRFGCTANRIAPPQHQFLENTIDSIQYAFTLGAEIVEIDIYPTTDKQFAIFHDWKLDCRTNGEGKTRDHTLAYLQSLDIGYGYTSDGGKSFPFRGKGIGKLPSLTEVLDTFPEQKFLINFKSNTSSEADLIDQYLDTRVDEDLSRLWFYGGNKPTSRLLSLRPELKGFTRKSVKGCAIDYILIGWSGYVPDSCRNTIVAIPKHYAPFVWGWPRKFGGRMNKVNTHIILVDQSHGHMDGIDDPQEIRELSKDYRGLIWTDKIEKTGRGSVSNAWNNPN